MVIFKPLELKDELIKCITYLKEKQTGNEGIQIDFYGIIADDFDADEFDNVVDEDYKIGIKLDNCPKAKISIKELIDLVEESRNILLHDKSMCISNKTALVRITECENEEVTVANELLCHFDDIFKTESVINNKKIHLSLVKGLSSFALINHFKGHYGGYFESFTELDKFIKISFKEQLTEEEVIQIVYSYLFELSVSHNLNYMLENFFYEESFEEPIIQILPQYELRPILFGEGLNEVFKIYNEAVRSVNNQEYSIIQYTKILEYVSQTVVRQEINDKAMTKLYSKKALNPDANYIKELEKLFIDAHKRYETDREAIRTTIETCCDLYEIEDIAPKFLNKINNLSRNNPSVDKSKMIGAVYEQLSNAISDTRNYLSHAKSNYLMKGNECPKEQLEQFAQMMNILATQTIRWFGKIHEDSRVL